MSKLKPKAVMGVTGHTIAVGNTHLAMVVITKEVLESLIKEGHTRTLKQATSTGSIKTEHVTTASTT